MQEIELVGVQDALKALDDIERKFRTKIARKMLRGGQKEITKEVKARTPVESGLTKSAVKTKAQRRSRLSIGINTMIGEGDFKGKTYYAAFGTFGLFNKDGSVRQAPNPYIKQGFDAGAPNAVKKIVEVGREEIEKIKAKAK